MPVVIEKARLNIWNVGGFILGIAVTAFGWGVTYTSMNNANEQTRGDVVKLQGDITDIKAQLPSIPQLQYQITRASEMISETRSSAVATNERIDRVVESFGGKLDSISENVNKIATRVEVLSTRIEAPQRTNFRMK